MWLSDLKAGMRVSFLGSDGKDYTGILLHWGGNHARVSIDSGEYKDGRLNIPIVDLRSVNGENRQAMLYLADYELQRIVDLGFLAEVPPAKVANLAKECLEYRQFVAQLKKVLNLPEEMLGEDC